MTIYKTLKGAAAGILLLLQAAHGAGNDTPIPIRGPAPRTEIAQASPLKDNRDYPVMNEYTLDTVISVYNRSLQEAYRSSYPQKQQPALFNPSLEDAYKAMTSPSPARATPKPARAMFNDSLGAAYEALYGR